MELSKDIEEDFETDKSILKDWGEQILKVETEMKLLEDHLQWGITT